MDLKMIKCSKCSNQMPELRKLKYGYDFCVECSETKGLVGKKMGVSVQMGEGDHSWNETIIVEERDYYNEEYKQDKNLESNIFNDEENDEKDINDLKRNLNIITNK